MWIRISETKHDTYEAADVMRGRMLAKAWDALGLEQPRRKARVRKRPTHYSCIVWEERPSPLGPKPEAVETAAPPKRDRKLPISPTMAAAMLLGGGFSPTTQSALGIAAQHEADENRRRLMGGE